MAEPYICKRCGVPHIIEVKPEFAILQNPGKKDEEIFYMCVWCAEKLKQFMNGSEIKVEYNDTRTS